MAAEYNRIMKNFKVLFVDDDLQILSIVEQFIQRWGYHVTTVSNGEQAIEAIRGDYFNVVFSDLIMPEIDGP